jgi:hypothetical protein
MQPIEQVFEIKLNYIIKMTQAFGAFIVPFSWWEYAAVQNKENEKVNNFGLHEYGTSFCIERLDIKFNLLYMKKLRAANIKPTILKDSIKYELLIRR